MSRFSVVSFDLQGTLTSTAFGEGFWLDVLPREAARHLGLGVPAAKAMLRDEFVAMGVHDRRYYDAEYWLERFAVDATLPEIWAREGLMPRFDSAMESVLRGLGRSHTVILVSATTRAFIEAELGGREGLFKHIVSTFDDLGLSGKPPRAFAEVARQLDVRPGECVHIGDDEAMDVANARAAGWEAIHWTGNAQEVIKFVTAASEDSR